MTVKTWLCAGVFSTLVGCSGSHLEIFPPLSDESLKTKAIPVMQLHEDIDAFVNGMAARHPNYEGYADQPAIDAHVEAMKARIDSPMTRLEFYREVGQLSYLFNDGHAFLIWPYQELNDLRDAGHELFPFRVEANADGLFVKQSYVSHEQPALTMGARVISINEVTAEQILHDAQRYVGGETLALREQVVADRLPQMLWSLYGFIDDYTVVVEYRNEQHTLVISSEHTWEPINISDHHDDDFYMTKLGDDTAYLYIGTFDVDVDWFESFIDESFAKLKFDGTTSLIIDIRNNGGGNTDSAEYLSRYVADRPFRMVSQVTEKVNTDNLSVFGSGELGDMIEQPWNDWVDPMSTEQRFQGDTYLLISQLSYSSSIVFATTLKDHNFATLIGQETGGFANQTAQGNLFNLPNSELRAYVATRLLVRPSGDTAVHGVIPDVTTEHDEASLLSEQDTEINAALELIRNRAN